MQLLGQEVNHKKYGKGVITELAENKITVRFEESQTKRKFVKQKKENKKRKEKTNHAIALTN